MTSVTNMDFKDVVNDIKNDMHGTLIIIEGRAGCGKSTLARQLLKDINGNTDLKIIFRLEDARYLDKFCTEENRAYLIDDNTTLDHRIDRVINEMVVRMTKVLILVVQNADAVPRKYHNLQKYGIRSQCVISFSDTEKGTFKIKGFKYDSNQEILYYKSVNKIALDFSNGTSDVSITHDMGYEEEDWEPDCPKQEMKPTLKPCPFCGGEVYMQRYGGTSHFYIMCKNCWLRVEDGFAPTRMPKEALAGFFNRRVKE